MPFPTLAMWGQDLSKRLHLPGRCLIVLWSMATRALDAMCISGSSETDGTRHSGFHSATGDLVADGNDSALWPIFFGIEKELLRRTVFFPSLGNHERNTHYFQELFHDGVPYYSFDWGNSHFDVIDSDIENVAPNERERNIFWTAQTRWLEDDLLAHQKSEYRFIAAITQKVASIENFVAVSVNGEIAHVMATAVDGRTLEQFDIQSSRH
jgi:hypothetical protein